MARRVAAECREATRLLNSGYSLRRRTQTFLPGSPVSVLNRRWDGPTFSRMVSTIAFIFSAASSLGTGAAAKLRSPIHLINPAVAVSDSTGATPIRGSWVRRALKYLVNVLYGMLFCLASAYFEAGGTGWRAWSRAANIFSAAHCR